MAEETKKERGANLRWQPIKKKKKEKKNSFLVQDLSFSIHFMTHRLKSEVRMFDFSHDVSQSSDHRCHLNDVSVWVCTFFCVWFQSAYRERPFNARGVYIWNYCASWLYLFRPIAFQNALFGLTIFFLFSSSFSSVIIPPIYFDRYFFPACLVLIQ